MKGPVSRKPEWQDRYTVRVRPWLERLFSWPWRPWRRLAVEKRDRDGTLLRRWPT